MNDHTDDANPHGIPRPTIGAYESADPDYRLSLNDTQVTQRLVDALEARYADAGDEDQEILKQTLNDLRFAYEAIRPDNDWALDIN